MWFLIITVVLLLAIAGIRGALKDRQGRRDFVNELALHKRQMLRLAHVDHVSGAENEIPYIPQKNERVLDHASLSDGSGFLIITNRAFVLETRDRNQRITLDSLSGIEIFSNAVRLRKRNGAPKDVRISPNPHFLALADRILKLER
jgi:hypothetical protein